MKKVFILTFIISLTLFPKPSFASEESRSGEVLIRKGEILEIKNKTLKIDGDLVLEDGSSLIMENGKLVITERYKSEHRIRAQGAKVIIKNSQIKSSQNVLAEKQGRLTGPELNVNMSDNTDIEVTNSQIYGRLSFERGTLAKVVDSTVSFIYWGYDTNLETTDSVLGSFVFDCKGGKTEDLNFSRLKKNKPTNLSFTSRDGGGFKLSKTNVKELWSFNLEWGCQKDITIEDSEIENLWIKFPPTDKRITIANLPRGLIKEYNLKSAVSGITLPYNLKLKNTQLELFKPEMWSTKALIKNSYAMVHPYDQSDLIIKDATLDNFFNYGSKRIEFYNVRFVNTMQLLYKPEFENGLKVGDKIVGPGGNFHFIFNNSVIEVPEIVIAMKKGKIEGELKIVSPRSVKDVHWIKGEIERIYSVLGNPNTPLELIEDGKTGWTGTTDAGGKATFSIIFNQENYNHKFALKNGKITREMSFLANTPINLNESSKETKTEKADQRADQRLVLVIVISILILGGLIFIFLRIKKSRALNTR